MRGFKDPETIPERVTHKYDTRSRADQGRNPDIQRVVSGVLGQFGLVSPGDSPSRVLTAGVFEEFGVGLEGHARLGIGACRNDAQIGDRDAYTCATVDAPKPCQDSKITTPRSSYTDGRGASCTIARPSAVIAATMPSIFSLLVLLSGLMFPAASVFTETLLTIQRRIGWPPWAIWQSRTRQLYSDVDPAHIMFSLRRFEVHMPSAVAMRRNCVLPIHLQPRPRGRVQAKRLFEAKQLGGGTIGDPHLWIFDVRHHLVVIVTLRIHQPVLGDELLGLVPTAPRTDVAAQRLAVDLGHDANGVELFRQTTPQLLLFGVQVLRHRRDTGFRLRLIWAGFAPPASSQSQ